MPDSAKRGPAPRLTVVMLSGAPVLRELSLEMIAAARPVLDADMQALRANGAEHQDLVWFLRDGAAATMHLSWAVELLVDGGEGYIADALVAAVARARVARAEAGHTDPCVAFACHTRSENALFVELFSEEE
jgi:hypothetical protein